MNRACFPKEKHQNSQKWAKCMNFFVLALSLVWFAGATPEKLLQQQLSEIFFCGENTSAQIFIRKSSLVSSNCAKDLVQKFQQLVGIWGGRVFASQISEEKILSNQLVLRGSSRSLSNFVQECLSARRQTPIFEILFQLPRNSRATRDRHSYFCRFCCFGHKSGILNLRFAKPIVCMRVAFHENDGNHENGSDSYKQGFECWIGGNYRNHGNDENHGNPRCKPRVPQTRV